jgi:uncharacterized protein YbjQ (UPF0145 family)
LVAHCQNLTSPSTDQSFVKELAKPTQEKIVFKNLKELEIEARKVGANAIVGVDLDFETIGGGGSMLMVIASGTAVVI